MKITYNMVDGHDTVFPSFTIDFTGDSSVFPEKSNRAVVSLVRSVSRKWRERLVELPLLDIHVNA